MDILAKSALSWAENGRVPDSLLRLGIRWACGNRLKSIREEYAKDPEAILANFIEALNNSPVAESTQEANEQHYELPEEFFKLVLGPRRKYSGCDWEPGFTLADAEEKSLEIICDRAALGDGQRVLELGCGWGSFSLYAAEKFPKSHFTGVSNSNSQREYIMGQARERGLTNLQIITCDINEFAPAERFDRIVTVEMLEHVRNYSVLFARISEWLEGDGKLFVHVFRHKDFAYLFGTDGAGNWMGKHFFTGGVMPSDDLLGLAQSSLILKQNWQIAGTHYMQTANAWLANMDDNRTEIMAILGEHYGRANANLWLHRWRIFFMACAELFGYAEGSEWGVSHYLFERRVNSVGVQSSAPSNSRAGYLRRNRRLGQSLSPSDP